MSAVNSTVWNSLCKYAIFRSRCAKELHGVISIFCKKVGNRVGKKSSKAKALTIFHRKGLIFMVRPARFELTAFGSGGQRSIRLSYGRTRFVLICRLAPAVKAATAQGYCDPAEGPARSGQKRTGHARSSRPVGGPAVQKQKNRKPLRTRTGHERPCAHRAQDAARG